ncbi:DUF2523 domain-containing protein [Vibrio parahaemolyticus]|nr:DUF2523 domain-containing protein [Vibrio parahaemolyticus]
MFNDALNFIKNLFIAFANTLFDIIMDVSIFIFDVIMEALILLINGFVELFEFMDFTEYFDMLPDDFINAANALGLSQAFTIIISAHFIKILLQLIPFVRLGAK